MPKEEKKIEPSFEENLTRLETIVKDLESGEVPLDDAINKFTEAMHLASNCNEKLKQAEEAVNQILGEDGTLQPFTPEEN